MEIITKLIAIVQFGIAHSSDIVAAAYAVLSAVSSLCVALIAFFLIIPGEQPEKAIQGFKDFIEKYSRK